MKIISLFLITLLFISPLLVKSDSDDDDDIHDFNGARVENGQILRKLVYDYVVIGAGASGSIVASKLSENRRNSVLLVEEGGWSLSPFINNAANWSYWNSKDADRTIQRMFYTAPQAYMNNRVLDDSRAYVVGGCSAHNAMNLITGSKENFDDFAQFTGSNQWSHDSIKSSIQDFKNHFNLIHEEPNIGLLPQLSLALESNGYSYNPTPFDTGAVANKYATYVLMMTTPNNTNGQWNFPRVRQTPYTQYVEKILGSRSNLDVLVHEKALRLDYGRKDGKLYVKGILIENVGSKRLTYVKIRKELVLSMGAYETPKFLQLNGIGDRTHLQSLGINTVVHSPGVGKNLRNHLFYYYVGKQVEAPYSSVVIPQVNPIGGGYIFYPTLKNVNGTNPTGRAENKLTCDFQFGRFRCFVENGNVRSSGYVKIVSNDHKVNPEINENDLMEQFDRDVYVNGMREMFKIQDTLVNMGVLKNESSPLGQFSSYNDILNAVKSTATNNHHPCCSVRMGPANDEMSPLTPELRLKGLKNVRVLDASSAPENWMGNINAAVSVMAIKGSEIIIATSN